MNQQADFTEDEVVKFQELPHKQPDLRRYQGAMFLDRPDLWPVIRRKRLATPPPEQHRLFKEGGGT